MSFLKVYTKKHPGSPAELIGAAARLMSKSAYHRLLPISHAHSMLAQAIQEETIRFYYNAFGRLAGYVIWANPTDSVIRRVVTTGQLLIYPGEWGSSPRKFVIDFLAPSGRLKYVLEDMRDSLFRHDQSLLYARIKFGRVIVKEVCRSRKSHFFSRAKEYPSSGAASYD